MTIVRIDGVTKRFNDFVAVRDLSFSVSQGSVFGLLGPNGAGKTTTIRMITNIFAPDEGTIEIMGATPSQQLQQRIGYLPEERGLYRKMKVAEQLVFFANLKGVDRRDAEERISRWLSRLELSEWSLKKAEELSKGMQQKIQFIAAVIHEPELLILDEPFSGLDPVSVSLLKNIILELKEKGTTIIFSTHQMEQVEQMCDEICLIDRSTKVLGGNLREIKRSFGRNTVLLDFEGPDSFLATDLVKQVNRYPTYSELLLRNGSDAQEILKGALDSGAKINRFELVEPSLNDIFIEQVTKAREETNANRNV